MGRRKSMAGAAATRDPLVVYETLVEQLSATFDATSSARDRCQLGNAILKAQSRIDELKGAGAPESREKPKGSEVTDFEVIARRRADRRAAAQG